jgi:hypothetical protein
MQEQPEVLAVADRAETANLAGMMLEVQFRGVLDRQNMTAVPRRPRLEVRADLLDRHPVMPPPEPALLGFRAGQPAQTDRPAHDHAPHQQSPPFFSRSSPKWPIENSACILHSPWLETSHTESRGRADRNRLSTSRVNSPHPTPA